MYESRHFAIGEESDSEDWHRHGRTGRTVIGRRLSGVREIPLGIRMVEGSLNSKLPTIWRVEKQMKSR